MFVFNRKRTIRCGKAFRVKAGAAIEGRPLAGMRAELRQGLDLGRRRVPLRVR